MTGPPCFSHHSGPDGKTNFGYGHQVRTVRITTKGPKLAEQGFISSGDEQGGNQFIREVAATAALAAVSAARSAHSFWILSEFIFLDSGAEVTLVQQRWLAIDARRPVSQRVQLIREAAATAALAAAGAARSARNFRIFSEFSLRDVQAELTVLQRARRDARRAVHRRVQTSLRRLEARRIANRK